MTIKPQSTNELNFGGGNNSTIYVGYRAVGNKPIPTKFVFGGSAGSANLTAASATLSGAISAASGNITNIKARDINVQGTLRSEKWDIQNITQLYNDFGVSPTFKLSSVASIIVAKPNSTTVTLTIVDASNITSDTIGGAVWANNSQVKVSGTLNGVVLGTCSGVTTDRMNTTTNRLNLSFTVASSDPLYSVAAGTYTVAAGTVSEFYCMLYTVGDYPVGIRLTSYGVNKNSQIDIYGGTAGSYANNRWHPVVRIGKLDGMLDASGNAVKVNGEPPTGWGLYTNNGYFDGVVVSSSGKIGGWNLSSQSLSIGTFGNDGGVYITPSYESSISIGGSPSDAENPLTWAITAGNKFGITTDGDLYANNAKISGEINATSGEIGGAQIENGVLQIGNGNIIAGAIMASHLNIGQYMTFQSKKALTTSEPADWSTNWTDYYTKRQIYPNVDSDEYNKVTDATCPVWTANTYYKNDSSNPQILIGSKDNFAVTIDRSQMVFWHNYRPVTYINGDEMEIPRSVMLNEMIIGDRKWSWREHGNNLCLKWIGG